MIMKCHCDCHVEKILTLVIYSHCILCPICCAITLILLCCKCIFDNLLPKHCCIYCLLKINICMSLAFFYFFD
ncbi:unnamed protein product [Meloidogyne enterolobii]|uniref:Uncharacterized protein n=1 Tax=Meloidogyne enterolobii TaxID=390850 RepID=A0ACB0Z9I6_MELEN